MHGLYNIKDVINYYKECKYRQGLMPYTPVERAYLMVIFASERTITFITIYNFSVQFLSTIIFLCLLSPQFTLCYCGRLTDEA
jgi:hypothetical protein